MSVLTLQDAAPPSQQFEDLEKSPVDKVLAALAVQPGKGLSSAEARERLTKYGPNAIVEKEISLAWKLLHHFTGPIAYMIEAAALVSAVIGHWDDFAIIMGLLLFNVALEMWQDRKASNALAALKKGLAPEAVAMRDGKWQTVRAAVLVPGDIVKSFRYGGGPVAAVVRPGSLVEMWRVLNAAVEAGRVVVFQAANTGLTGGSTPWGEDYDREIVLISVMRLKGIHLINNGRQVLCLPGATLDALEKDRWGASRIR